MGSDYEEHRMCSLGRVQAKGPIFPVTGPYDSTPGPSPTEFTYGPLRRVIVSVALVLEECTLPFSKTLSLWVGSVTSPVGSNRSSRCCLWGKEGVPRVPFRLFFVL